MYRHYRQSRKIIVAVSMAALFLPALPLLAEPLPSKADIFTLSTQAGKTITDFMAETIEFRLGYEYKDKFLQPGDREKLNALAEGASARLSHIIAVQQKLKQQIEDYHGSDWDSRFGTTGLWRTLTADLSNTIRFKCDIDYHLALCADANEIEPIRRQILTSLTQSRYDTLLKARLYALSDTADARTLLDFLLAGPAAADEIYFTAAITKLKLLPAPQPQQLSELLMLFESGQFADDFELSAKFAFLRRRFGSADVFEPLLTKWPQAYPFIAMLLMGDLLDAIEKDQFHENYLSPFEVDCAIQYNDTDIYEDIIESLLAIKKFQTPVILYAGARTYLKKKPKRAVKLFIDASVAQLHNKSVTLTISAEQIALRAAQVAYNLFVHDPNNCALTGRAISNYLNFNDAEFFSDYEYLYTNVLRSCGSDSKASRILSRIATRPEGGRYVLQARYELMIEALNATALSDRERAELLAQLKDFITKLPRSEPQHSDLRAEAVHSYCRLGLQVDEIYAPAVVANLPQILLSLGKDSHCFAYIQFLLGRIVERIDQYADQMPDFTEFVKDCHNLSVSFHNCQANKTNITVAIIRAELAVFAASGNEPKLMRIEKSLDNIASQAHSGNIELLRCRARLMTALHRYAKAAELWSKIASVRQSDPQISSRHSMRWWRAKIYELNCWAKIPNTDPKKVLHSIEVLASTPDIPPFWTAKIENLAVGLR